MPKSGRPKKKPPIEASNNKSTFTFSFSSSSSSSGLVRQGERREHPQTPEKEKALYKEIAPIKETYAERLKKDLPSSSSLPSSLLLPLPSAPSPSSRSFTST